MCGGVCTGARESACTVRSHVCVGGTGVRDSACTVRSHMCVGGDWGYGEYLYSEVPCVCVVGRLGLERVPVQ